MAELDGLHTDGRVRLIRDGREQRYALKVHTSPERHEREVRAYQQWVPALKAHAPHLIAHSADIGVILTTAVPGRQAGGTTLPPRMQRVTHQRAGALLRLFHAAEPVRSTPRRIHELAGRARWWLAQADRLLSQEERCCVERHIDRFATLTGLDAVVCHLDYQPHNWLVHKRAVNVVDFEHARIDLRVRDFVRLTFRHWVGRPDLREAFCDGYGRSLTDAEQQAMMHCGALDAVTALVRAHATDNPSLAAHGRRTLHQLLTHPAADR